MITEHLTDAKNSLKSRTNPATSEKALYSALNEANRELQNEQIFARIEKLKIVKQHIIKARDFLTPLLFPHVHMTASLYIKSPHQEATAFVNLALELCESLFPKNTDSPSFHR